MGVGGIAQRELREGGIMGARGLTAGVHGGAARFVRL